MKVLLTKDVFKLGRAGDVKKVADGFARNFLMPRGLAVLATEGSLKNASKIRAQGEVQRAALNSQLKELADHVNGLTLNFVSKAGETGKLYGSITTQDVANAIQEQTRYEVKRHQIDMQPIRETGEHKANVRLTVDLIPQVTIFVRREGEAVTEEVMEEEKPAAKRGKKKAETAAPPAAEEAAAPAAE